MKPAPHRLANDELRYPEWFLAFMAERAILKPSPLQITVLPMVKSVAERIVGDSGVHHELPYR